MYGTTPSRKSATALLICSTNIEDELVDEDEEPPQPSMLTTQSIAISTENGKRAKPPLASSR